MTSFVKHFPITSEIKCVACTSDITAENYVLYKQGEKKEEVEEWTACKYCNDCIIYMLENSWELYIHSVVNADCLKALTKLLTRPPPINFRDSLVPCPDNNDEVSSFYYDGSEKSANLVGSFIGEERDSWYADMKEKLRQMKEDE